MDERTQAVFDRLHATMDRGFDRVDQDFAGLHAQLAAFEAGIRRPIWLALGGRLAVLILATVLISRLTGG